MGTDQEVNMFDIYAHSHLHPIPLPISLRDVGPGKLLNTKDESKDEYIFLF